MTAAAITPSVVAEVQLAMDSITGTAPRVRRFYIKGTKAAQNDWILIQSALGYTDISDKILGWHAITTDASHDNVIDILTYTDSTDKAVFSSTTVGTLHVWIDVQAE